MKKNGFMIYELVISFALAFAILLVIFNTSISLNRRLSDLYVKNKVSSKQIILNKKIGDSFTNKDIESINLNQNTCTVEYKDNTNTKITINNADNNKYIMVGNEKIIFDNNVNIEKIEECSYNENFKFYTIKIPIKYNNNDIDYGIELYNYDNNISNSVIYKDSSGANSPKLASGMIPVVYDETSGNWEVADTNSEWYNYEEQMWANAVTTSDASNRTAPAGTEIPMESINSMWVWIPRYKYRIPSSIGVGTSTPPEIDVVFESGTETTGSTLSSCPITSTSCYYTHPAFRNGSSVYKTTAYDQGGWDEELTGIWVGKFETGTEGDTCSSSPSTTNCQNVNPVIKPDVRSLRYQTVSTQFDTSLKFAGGTRSTSTGEVTFSGNSTYGLTSSTDAHMMKNTEWGAVAYLSQSQYGKIGNSNYTGTNKEIYINNSGANTYTGRSGGGPSGSTPINGTYPDQTSTTQYNTYGFYTYDDYLLNYNTNTKGSKVTGKGVGASTTGTIYGVYDMSGGTHEYTMSNWAGEVGYSGFTTSNFPGGSNGSKYYEKYTGTSSNTPTAEKSIKGDATYETMRWYSVNTFFAYVSYPWFSHSGNYSTTSVSGIFYSLYNIGTSRSDTSFRVAIIP